MLCQALPDLLRKTILTFCEGSVKFERKLEVIGSVHVRSDSEKVVTFLLDEQVSVEYMVRIHRHAKQGLCWVMLPPTHIWREGAEICFFPPIFGTVQLKW